MLSIIIVNYNTRDLLQKCLDSIISHIDNVTSEIVVVDNASADGSPKMVEESYPQVILKCNVTNVGFSGANNQGVNISSGEYLLFLNSDTLVLDDAIFTMLDYLEKHHDVGIVGPKILNPENKPTRSYMRFLRVTFFFLGSKYLSPFIDTGKYRIHYDHYDYDAIRSVEWLSGACLMMRRNVFEDAGCFDEHYFLYFEDMDLCMQVKKLGYSNVYLPEAGITHFFGGSTDSEKGKLNKIYRQSASHYFRKNFPFIEYLMAKLYISMFWYRVYCERTVNERRQ